MDYFFSIVFSRLERHGTKRALEFIDIITEDVEINDMFAKRTKTIAHTEGACSVNIPNRLYGDELIIILYEEFRQHPELSQQGYWRLFESTIIADINTWFNAMA